MDAAYGPMNPPRSGRVRPSGHTRSRVRPWPSSGAAMPHAVHGSRMIAAAARSGIAKGTRCSAARRWYWRRRAICGKTLEAPADEPPVRSATFCSIERRHLEQKSASSFCEAEVDGCEAEAEVDDALKNCERPCCFVLSSVRRHEKHNVDTLPLLSSAAWRSFLRGGAAIKLGGARAHGGAKLPTNLQPGWKSGRSLQSTDGQSRPSSRTHTTHYR